MIERLFYGLPALETRWNCSSDDLMQMGVSGQAKIYHDLLGVGDRRWYASQDESHRYLEYWFEVPVPQKPPDLYLCTPKTLRLIAKGLPFNFARFCGLHQSNLAYFNPPITVEAADLCMLPTEVERLDLQFGQTSVEANTAPRWPWGNHETHLLGHLAAAGKQWWSTYDPDYPAGAPRNEEVAKWLRERGVESDRMADAMHPFFAPMRLEKAAAPSKGCRRSFSMATTT